LPQKQVSEGSNPSWATPLDQRPRGAGGRLARLSTGRSRVRLPSGALTQDRTVRQRPSGGPQTSVCAGSNPARATRFESRRVGWALVSLGGRNPPASGFAGSTPARRTDRRWPVRLSDRIPGSQPGEAGSTPARAALDRPLMRVSRSLSGTHNPGLLGSTPRPAMSLPPCRQTGKAASLRGWCLWVRLPPRRFSGTRPVV
jgi:hypothetical protein